MRQLIYISTKHGEQSEEELSALLSSARARNRSNRVSGLLLFNGLRFLQVLEGPADAIEETYGRIQADGRHRSIVILGDRTIEKREFADWSMAFEQPRSGKSFASLAAQVERAVTGADRKTQALFESFAKVA